MPRITEHTGSGAADRDLLSRHLTVVWIVLTIYGCLYPFSGWRGDAVAPFAYLNFDWPYYWTTFDIVINVLVYMPLGFFAVLAAMGRFPGSRALALAVFLGADLSFVIETLQNWLPSRVASNLDLACNTAGTFLGGLFALWAGPRYRAVWRLWRQRLLAPLPHADLGLTFLGLWLLLQLSPEIMLFGVGDLRHSLDLITLEYGPRRYRVSETAVIFCNLIAVGLFVSVLTRGRWRSFLTVPLFFLLAGFVRALGAAVLAGPENGLAWLTLGARHGLAMGAITLTLLLLFPLRWRLGFSVLALLAGAVLVNLTPLNPYSTIALELWRRGHFLNFNGLTRWMAIIWPFAAWPYLAWLFFHVRKRRDMLAK
ncbi:MAG: VanZ family protein [Zoogloeaceae bacterium]|nr:VanZ family protein [Zoogloeaceae bacterium]